MLSICARGLEVGDEYSPHVSGVGTYPPDPYILGILWDTVDKRTVPIQLKCFPVGDKY